MIPQSSWINTLIVLPTLTPLLGAALTLLQGRHPRFQRAVTVTAIAVALVASSMMLTRPTPTAPTPCTSAGGVHGYPTGRWASRSSSTNCRR